MKLYFRAGSYEPSPYCYRTPYMQVTYSADVEWRSPQGVLVRFEDTGEAMATTNGIKISALAPATTYQFRVSAITQSGRGAEVGLVGQTQPSPGTK